MPPLTTMITFTVTRRPLWQRIIRLPFVGYRHYASMRRTEGRIVSAYAAWLLAGVTVTIGKAK